MTGLTPKILIIGAWITVFIIFVLNADLNKAVYIPSAIFAGIIFGIVYLLISFAVLRKISKENIEPEFILNRFTMLHLPLYLLWIYVLKLNLYKMGPINRYLPFIVIFFMLPFLIRLLRCINLEKYIPIILYIIAYTSIIILTLLWFFPFRGLIGTYYDTLEWSGEPIMVKRDMRIDSEEISANPDIFPQINFSVRWEGFIRIDEEGEYRFATRSDDGSWIIINEKLIVDNGGIHAPRRRSGTIYLEKGIHSIRILYFQAEGDYELKVYWTPPDNIERNISPLVLYTRAPDIPGWIFLSRHLFILYPSAWLFLLLITIGINLYRKRDNLSSVLKEYAVNAGVTVITLIILLIFAEISIRIIYHRQEERREDIHHLLEQAQEAEFIGGRREFSLRGMVQSSPYDGLVYELKPNLQGIFAGVPIFTNSKGFRDFEYDLQKGKDTIRITGIGDSCIFGWGIPFEDMTMKVLEKKLNDLPHDIDYEIMSFGVPGYNMAMKVELFAQRALRYSPDLVILHFFDTDYDAPFFMKKPQSYTNLRRLYIFDFIYSNYQILTGFHHEDAIDYTNFEENPDIRDEYQYMTGPKGFTRAIERIVEITEKRNIPLIVYSAKAYPGLHESYIHFPLEENHLNIITELSEKHGFYFVNTYPYYIDYVNENPGVFYPNDFKLEDRIHYNRTANHIDAQALFNFLKENDYLIRIPD